MFRSALLKLTSFYFILLLTVCISLSVPAYLISSDRINRGSSNQLRVLNEFARGPLAFPDREMPPTFDPRAILKEQVEKQRNDDRRELLRGLILVNFFVLAGGTILCFYFAKRTLTPIEKLHEAQANFTSHASHELRTPLSVMKAEIEVALRQQASKEKLRDVLKSNLEEIERLTDLSDQLLALTLLENRENTKELFSLSELVTKDIENFEKQNKIKIDTDINPEVSIEGIPTLISDYLRILLNNAMQYIANKPAIIKVSLNQLGDSKAKLSVRDNGIGISKDDINKIFTRFYRVNQASTHHGSGHGLGLSLASEIAKIHGTRIEVDSELGLYTEFSIVLNQK